MSTELMPQRPELVPQAAVIALLVNPNNPIAERGGAKTLTVCPSAGAL
jgi:hypothetical protein